LASTLQDLGYETAIEPLLSILPIAGDCPQQNGVDAVMITSGNAMLALHDRRSDINSFSNLPCFCVGSHTAEKARAEGFRQVHDAASNGAGLATLINRTYPGKNISVLHIAGRDVNGKARQELEDAGHRVIEWPVYEAQPVTALTSLTKDRLKQRKFNAVMVFSPRTAQVFHDLLASASLEACCESLAAICLSDAVADVLKPFRWRHLVAAPQPTEKAAIACLQAICPVKS